MEKLKVGVLGCGRISNIYLTNCTGEFKYVLDVVACADLNREAAENAAEKYSIPKVCSVDELFELEEVDVILNLTNNWVHYETNLRALNAGKHVYCEKPLARTREQAMELVKVAKGKNLRIGCAPDTFMGASHQTARQLLDQNACGIVKFANAFIGMSVDSEIYAMDKHGGVQFDMGTYYVAALINLFGPVKRIIAMADVSADKKVYGLTSSPFYGKEYNVEIPTTTSGVLEFDGVLVSFTTTNDSIKYWPRLEVVGTEATMYCGDPNYFGEQVSLEVKWNDTLKMPLTHLFGEDLRGVGLADMAHAIDSGRKHRANGDLACHIVDILESMWESAKTGKAIELITTCERPEALPNGHSRNPLL